MTIDKNHKPVWFTLDFSPDAELVVVVRNFVDDFCNRILDGDNRGLLSVAIHELLENGVKHSADGRVHVHIEVRRTQTGVNVNLQTRNAVTAEDREAIQALLAARAGAKDLQDFYHGMMLKPGPGGLGLARIMAETGMHLEINLAADDVHITGTVEFPLEEVVGGN